MDFLSDLGRDFLFIYLYFCGKSNVLFHLLFNAAFAHRAAVDNKHPSVFMLSLSCKNPPPPKSLPSENIPSRVFCSTWVEVHFYFGFIKENGDISERYKVFASLCSHVCSISKLSKCYTTVTNNDLLLTH